MRFGASHCVDVWAPREVSLTTMSIAIAFMTVTVPGNLLVIIAVILDPNRNLRTPFTLFIVNLAATDLIVGAVVEPLSINTHYREAVGKSISISWLSQFVYFMSCTASLLSLAGLTVDRYLAITSPMWYRANVSFTRAGKASIIIWTLSFAFSTIFFEVGFVPYAFVFANIALFCTFFIFIFSYVRIFQSVKNQVKELEELNEGQNVEQNRARQRAVERESKLTKTYLIMLIVFLSCYGPSVVMIYLMNLCSSCSCEVIHWLRDWHFVFVITNSLINPFLYAHRLPNFKSAFVVMLRRIKCWKTVSNNVAPIDPTPANVRPQNRVAPNNPNSNA